MNSSILSYQFIGEVVVIAGVFVIFFFMVGLLSFSIYSLYHRYKKSDFDIIWKYVLTTKDDENVEKWFAFLREERKKIQRKDEKNLRGFSWI
jgi:hypothetical protein